MAVNGAHRKLISEMGYFRCWPRCQPSVCSTPYLAGSARPLSFENRSISKQRLLVRPQIAHDRRSLLPAPYQSPKIVRVQKDPEQRAACRAPCRQVEHRVTENPMYIHGSCAMHIFRLGGATGPRYDLARSLHQTPQVRRRLVLGAAIVRRCQDGDARWHSPSLPT